jgi:hypothetical protein
LIEIAIEIGIDFLRASDVLFDFDSDPDFDLDILCIGVKL